MRYWKPLAMVLPAILIGGLAVDRAFQGRQIAAALPFDAMNRA